MAVNDVFCMTHRLCSLSTQSKLKMFEFQQSTFLKTHKTYLKINSVNDEIISKKDVTNILNNPNCWLKNKI